MVAYMSRVLKYEFVRVAQFARPMDSRTMMPMQRMLWIVQKGRRTFFDQGEVVKRDIFGRVVGLMVGFVVELCRWRCSVWCALYGLQYTKMRWLWRDYEACDVEW